MNELRNCSNLVIQNILLKDVIFCDCVGDIPFFKISCQKTYMSFNYRLNTVTSLSYLTILNNKFVFLLPI